LVAVDVNATKRPSGLTDAWFAGAEAGVTPSEPTETKVIVGVHPAATPAQGFAAKTWEVVPSKLNPETRSVASELNATTFAADDATAGCELAPFAKIPVGPTLTRISFGEHPVVTPRHVSRRNMFGAPFVSGLGGGLIVVVSSKFVEDETNAMKRPVASIAGPEVAGLSAPSFACAPSAATSTSSGSPAPVNDGTMEKNRLPEVPPPGVGFTTCTGYVPAAARSPLASCASSVVEPPNVVGLPLPFTSTWLAESKPFPVTRIEAVVVVPATTTGGETALITGLGFTMFNKITFDTPPPGGVIPDAGGFKTAIRSVPAVAMSDD
jgi:hypothetical protein